MSANSSMGIITSFIALVVVETIDIIVSLADFWILICKWFGLVSRNFIANVMKIYC